MEYQDYGPVRWKLLIGQNPGPTERKAVCMLYGMIRTYLPYILTVCDHPEEITGNDHMICIGTLEGNGELARLAAAGVYEPEKRKEGYAIRVLPSAARPGRTDVIIQGADPVGVLYGVSEFEHAYLDDMLKYHGYHYEDRLRPFIDPCPAFSCRGAPAIVNRGLWTWGHKIYDYRGYLDNMARCRLNLLVMWNDSVPLNAREIVEYAHVNGIRVIWGFTCAWGEDVRVHPTDPEEVERWGRHVVEVYEREYLPVGGDGVYFQAFTERREQTIDGVPVAKLITGWINRIAELMHTAYPGLYIQFGIHATSIREYWGMLRDLTPEVTPVWEDCGGFPFHYDPRQGDVAQTLHYCGDLLSLSRDSGRFGAVLKGFTVLRWKAFEHYKGRIIVGETDAVYRRRRLSAKQFYWKFSEPYWLNHAGDLQAFCHAVSAAGLTDSTVTALVEDGLFEEEIAPSVGLYAELLWDSEADVRRVIEKIYHSEHFGH